MAAAKVEMGSGLIKASRKDGGTSRGKGGVVDGGGRGQEVLKVQHLGEGGILRRRGARKGKNKDEIENVANGKIEGRCGRERRRSRGFSGELGPQITYD